MQHDVQSSARTALSSARVSPVQTRLQDSLAALDIQMAERFAPRPHFHEFVRQAFAKHFPMLKPAADLLRCFIQVDDPAQKADLQTIPPSLMDAVVRRIVSGQASDYAQRKASFHCASDSGGEALPYTALTPEAFDTFLDQMAVGVPAQYTRYLQRYWTQTCSPTDPRTYKQWLVDTRIKQLKAEVALLKNDGLLSVSAVGLFEKVLRYPDAQARQALEDYRPCVYAIALRDSAADVITLHGAFILTARDPQDAEVRWESEVTAPVVRPVEPNANVGTVLLFTPNNGLEEFESLASLDRELHRRLSHAIEFAALIALVADQDQARVITLQGKAPERDQVKYLERLDSPFDYGIESQCRLIRANLDSTLARYVKQGVHADMANLPAAIDRVTDLRRAFDIQPIMEARLRKQCKARLIAFLKDATSSDKQAWAVAFKNYAEALSSLPEYEGLPSLEQFSDRRELLAYSNRQLRVALEAEHGLTVNPDDVVVHTKEPELPINAIPSGAPGTSIREPGEFRYKHRQRTLTELALDNISGIDHNFTRYAKLSLKTAVVGEPKKTGPSKPPAAEALTAYDDLTVEQVKNLIRTTNVGQAHQDFLKASLVTSPAALARKQSFAGLVERQLRLDALEAKINGDFLPDRLERGFHWVQAVLDAPTDSDQRKTVEGHRVTVQYLQLRGQRVRGVLLFATASAGTGSIVVYTPGAPGGRAFHEYPKERLMVDFVHNSSWRDYLVGRVDRAFQAQVQATLKGRGDVSTVNMTSIANNVFEDAYEVEANFAINDAAAQVTTTHQTNVETGLLITTTVIDVLTMVLPVHVTLPLGIARSLISIFNAVEAGQIGDRAGAAQHIVRALAEFTGVLIDGVMGAAVLRGAIPGATRVDAGGRNLNPQMALGKKPDGLIELKGWEGKGIYYKRAKGDNAKRYFLNDRKHWYSIIDEGFEEAWRIRDARKPFQKHYSPIRRTDQGQWEIGTHPDAPALGGISPQDALRNLYPFLDEHQARRVFEAFNFPRGREVELGLSFVEHLRSGTATLAFAQYMRVSDQILRMRLLGHSAPAGFSGGRVAHEPTAPVVSGGGPSQPRPPAPLPPVRIRPPQEKFLDWGQRIEAGDLEQVNAELGIYKRKAVDQRPTGPDYIKIDDHYYPILPSGEYASPDLAFIFDNRIDINHFAQFEHLISTDMFSQPRPVYFAPVDKRWVNSFNLSFNKTITSYVGDAFPTFSSVSRQQVAQTLFGQANPNGVTASGLAIIFRTLKSWRGRSLESGSLGDPLSLLPVTPKNAAGQWLLESYSGPFNRLRLRTDGIETLLHGVMRSGTEDSLRALLSERLVSSGYEIIPGYRLGSELLFKRPGRAQLFWLTSRRVLGDLVDGSQYVAPRSELMDDATRTLVTQAQAANQFVSLVGGVRIPVAGAAVEVFVIRV
ncbi:hypothetical protein NTD84_27220 [Pseudomonas sp. 14P_8.1_Bac3]|uniref:dermonecrotic toxin domain-containing protein n=1 Tax=Pseudomonas sp. 14P_8.1_Bac3 TaxID=2971621 RepID=UPI0021CA5B16|nr:DUF6543 domain-containing protein [Pseudomonas sp. 14P_8.1_Bac3]MCU1763393.1 hypothetical protein [Pseudomonas sp. 14P_8.1_Bac3]